MVCWRLLSQVQEVAGDIVNEQTPKKLFAVRGKLYELLVNCLPPELILRRLALELISKMDDELKHKVAELAATYEHRLQVLLKRFLLFQMRCWVGTGTKRAKDAVRSGISCSPKWRPCQA